MLARLGVRRLSAARWPHNGQCVNEEHAAAMNQFLAVNMQQTLNGNGRQNQLLKACRLTRRAREEYGGTNDD
jgi:hypothetical protein